MSDHILDGFHYITPLGRTLVGYRSTIVIAMNQEAYLKHAVLTELPAFFSYEKAIKDEESGNYYWHFDGYKWYESYTDIKEMNKFFDVLEKEEKDLPAGNAACFGFIRLGEDSGDVEEKGDPWHYDIYVTQAIESPVEVLR